MMGGTMPSFDGCHVFGKIDDGYYRITVEETDQRVSSKDNPMIVVRFSIDGRFETFSDFFVIELDGQRNMPGLDNLMALVIAAGLSTNDGGNVEDLLGKQLGARLYMDKQERIKSARYIDPGDDNAKDIEWENEAVDDIPF